MEEIEYLSQAIAKATIEVGGFVADKLNKEQNYKYISADQVLDRAGIALAKAGVVVIPSITDKEITAFEYQGRTGETKRRIDAIVTFVMSVRFRDVVNECEWIGCGSDYATPDKALYKAITSGHKYFLMKLLNISVGNEDGEHENEPSTPVQNARANVPVVHQNGLNSKVDAEKVNLPMHAENGVKTPVLTIDEAEAMLTREGQRYGELSTEDIRNRLNASAKVKNPTDAQLYKIDMMKILYDARRNGRAVLEPKTLLDTAAELGGVVAE